MTRKQHTSAAGQGSVPPRLPGVAARSFSGAALLFSFPTLWVFNLVGRTSFF